MFKATSENHHSPKNNSCTDFSQGWTSPLLSLAKAGVAISLGAGVTSPTSWFSGQEDHSAGGWSRWGSLDFLSLCLVSPHHLSSMVTLGHQISYYQLRDPDVHVPGEPERRHTTVYDPVWEAVPGYFCHILFIEVVMKFHAR